HQAPPRCDRRPAAQAPPEDELRQRRDAARLAESAGSAEPAAQAGRVFPDCHGSQGASKCRQRQGRRRLAQLPPRGQPVTRRRGPTAIASNPVLVGVATTLVIVVAVFLAYNANQGLPWVPSYRLTADVPSAANLVKGNEARIGGLRVGLIDKIDPVQTPNGSFYSKLRLKLETRVKPLP